MTDMPTVKAKRHLPSGLTGQAGRTERGEEIDVSASQAKHLEAIGYAEITGESGEVDATDSAKELAEEEGIDLAEIDGTGSDGRIIKSDVESAISEGGD